MNLYSLEIPEKCDEIIDSYEKFYHSFYLEMIRMGSESLLQYFDDFLQKLISMARTTSPVNHMRTAFGVISLHRFGYPNYKLLTETFDRVLPQSDAEFAKFSSWCAGQLICHPNFERSRYVQHLFDRCIGWIRHKGYRARPFAATYMIGSLSYHAGNIVINYFHQIQLVMWTLVSHPSVQLVQATASALAQFTGAMAKYGRSDLESYLRFFHQLCERLLSFGSAIKTYAALTLIRGLIQSNPDFFIEHSRKMARSFQAVMQHCPQKLLVLSAAYNAASALSGVDPDLFVDPELFFADGFLLEQTERVLHAFPRETVDSLCSLLHNVPSFMLPHIPDMRRFALEHLLEQPDCAFDLLACLIDVFGQRSLPIEAALVAPLLAMPVTAEYARFFGAFTRVSIGEGGCERPSLPDFQTRLEQHIIRALKTNAPMAAIGLVAHLPQTAVVSQSLLMRFLKELSTSKDVGVRAAVPAAMLHLAETCASIDKDEIVHQLMQNAVYDTSAIVRLAILELFAEKKSPDLAKPQYMKFLHVFVNDDSQTTRETAFKMIANISMYNPLIIAAITRSSLLDYFFVLRHIPDVRQRSRIAKSLPMLIEASMLTISTYSGTFMDIAIEILTGYMSRKKSNNNLVFLEKDANFQVLIAIFDSLAILAPAEPELLEGRIDLLIPIMCDILLADEYWKLSLSIIKLLEVLFTPPASRKTYRLKAPLVYSVVSSFLSRTSSRRARAHILRVFGAIGAIEVHQQPPARLCRAPKNVDKNLTRQFFRPSRDTESQQQLSLNPNRPHEYFVSVALVSLLSILGSNNLKEFYFEATQCFVVILGQPKMYMLCYFDAFMERFLQIMSESSDIELLGYMPLLTRFVKNSSNNTAPFLEQILQMIYQRFNHHLAAKILDLIIALLDSVRDNFNHYVSPLICLLISYMDIVQTSDEQISEKVLIAFSKICVYANDLLYLIIPRICDAVICEQSLEKVRIMSLDTIQSIVKSTDLFDYIGPIVRALMFGLESENALIRASAMQLLYTLIRSQGKKLLLNSEPLLSYLKKKKLETLELRQIIAAVNQSPSSDCFRPIVQQKRTQPREEEPGPTNKQTSFSEDAIIARALTPNLGAGRHLEQWLRSFMLTTISNSPSDQIRTCTTLATAYLPLANELFRPAFLSCWIDISTRGRTQISNSFIQLLLANENYESIAHVLIDLFVFMHQSGNPLLIETEEIVKACLKYGNVSFALKVTQEVCDAQTLPDAETISTLIEIFVQSNNWSDALCIWNRYNERSASMSADILKRLKMWNTAEPVFEQRYRQEGDFHSFQGLAESLSALAKFPQLLEYFQKLYHGKTDNEISDNKIKDNENNKDTDYNQNNIDNDKEAVQTKYKKENNEKEESNFFPRYRKFQMAELFAEAAFHMQKWDILEEVMKFQPSSSVRCIAMEALEAVHRKEYDKVDNLLEKGFFLLASKPLGFWAENKQINLRTMEICQQMVEIKELSNWAQNKNRKEIEEVWEQRLITSPRDFSLWFDIIGNRVPIKGSSSDDFTQFFLLRSMNLGTLTHRNVFDTIFPNYDAGKASGAARMCHAIVDWMCGEKESAISQMEQLSKTQSARIGDRQTKMCKFYYASWLLSESEDGNKESLLKAFTDLKDVVSSLNIAALLKMRKPASKLVLSTITAADLQSCAFGAELLHFPPPSFSSSLLSSLSSSLTSTLSSSLSSSLTSSSSSLSSSSSSASPSSSAATSTLASMIGCLQLPNERQKALFIDTLSVDILRKWAEVNTSLAMCHQENLTVYATNAIDALSQCAAVMPSFPDVVQLLYLFFENAHRPAIFNSTAHTCIEKLNPKLLLQASPQLLIQLSHGTPEVAKFVHDIVFRLVSEHFHHFLFSVIVMKYSKNSERARAARRIFEEFHAINPQAYEEVDLIRESLLRAAVTWPEKILQSITDAFDHLSVRRVDRMVASLANIVKITKKPRCEMHEQFLQTHTESLNHLESILVNMSTNNSRNIRNPRNTNNLSGASGIPGIPGGTEEAQAGSIAQLVEWCKMMEMKLKEEIMRIRMLQLSAISTSLAAKTGFILAVPGTYRPFKPVIRIEYFVGQFSVYLSKQQPKDVVVMGDDGIFYQYLLKGHEDLRLDERIMQFFHMINSFVKKSNTFKGNMIEALFVMPLSVSHGLVQWVSGTDTLRAVVEMYRKLHQKDPLEEYVLAEKITHQSFDFLQPIQKMHVLQKIFARVPDTDIADVFWMKAQSAESWLKQTNTFSVSTAMTSIVGYVIGLGDRHPSNLLVDRNTGKVIHIDFGDCFEKAARRRFLPEVVPFRLTRMMTKAMGVTGADGLFKHSFIEMSYILRENKRVLVLVLAVFVHEPLIDPNIISEEETPLAQSESLVLSSNSSSSSSSSLSSSSASSSLSSASSSLSSSVLPPSSLSPTSRKILSKAAAGSAIDRGRVYMADGSPPAPISSVEMRNRINQKLIGADFGTEAPLSVKDQAERLIMAATDTYNLAMMYSGWCPFW